MEASGGAAQMAAVERLPPHNGLQRRASTSAAAEDIDGDGRLHGVGAGGDRHQHLRSATAVRDY